MRIFCNTTLVENIWKFLLPVVEIDFKNLPQSRFMSWIFYFEKVFSSCIVFFPRYRRLAILSPGNSTGNSKLEHGIIKPKTISDSPNSRTTINMIISDHIRLNSGHKSGQTSDQNFISSANI